MDAWDRERAYCLEISVDDAQVMGTVQVSGYPHQLLTKKVGWLVDSIQVEMGMSTSFSLATLGLSSSTA